MYSFYHLSAKIGHTPHGAVYLGRDKASEVAVAIAAEDKASLPLHRILLLTKRDLSIVHLTQTHESLVRVVDLFESTRRCYTITELVSGGPLAAQLSAPLPERVARPVLRDVLRALAHLHAAGAVHGRVDAHHVVCVRRALPCRVKLVAFGAAAMRRDARLLAGDAARAAPEVVCFQRRSARSDVFAAGALLFAMLAGAPPFPAAGEASYLSAVSRGVSFAGPPADAISPEARKLLAGMLADDAGARPTASECLDAAWFRGAVSEVDAAAGEEGFGRCGSDPKTVIVDFEMAAALTARLSGGALSRHGSGEEVDTYGVLD